MNKNKDGIQMRELGEERILPEFLLYERSEVSRSNADRSQSILISGGNTAETHAGFAHPLPALWMLMPSEKRFRLYDEQIQILTA